MQKLIIRRLQNYTKKQSNALLIHSISTCIPERTNVESWTTLISLLAQGGPDSEFALFEASKILDSGFKPNGYSLVNILRASTDLGFNSYCQQLHTYILKSGFVSNVFVSTALIGFYRKIESLSDANKLFVEIPQPSVVSWNSLISGNVQSGKYREALRLFLELERSEVYADAYSFTAALAACGHLGLLQLGKSVHSKIVKYGLECGVVVANCLIDMYGKCGLLEDAISVFNKMVDKDIISWNSVIAASARNDDLEQAFRFFHQLRDPDTISYNELINGIAQFGNMKEAIEILSIMPKPNSSSWNSILTGYVHRNRAHEALEFFYNMKSEDVEMDEYTFSITLSGIASLAALTWGRLIHCCTIKQGLNTSIVVASALIDMYSKCGQLKDAELMFRSLSKKNLITWNAMITGYAHNGDSTKVIQLFEQLKMVRDLQPDWVTFLNVLSACSHNEIPLHQAIRYFESMIKDYGIEPTVEHCCSMVRLMGQNGEVYRAMWLIYQLGFASYRVVWRALLGACVACGELKVAKISAAKVIRLEGGDDDYVYVTMSNIFARHGKWGEVSIVRKFMQERGVRKEAGCSWIEVENITPYEYILR
ncbi:hypothetical protein Q3G72_007283 [Acer saccharum]|nr:hypothetical protein Q3G72_007283 [Acer saccharum]